MKWDYSNVAVALAGYVVERVSKQSFSFYVETAFSNRSASEMPIGT